MDDHLKREPLHVPADFPFPFPAPYSIQNDFMKSLYRVLENRQLGIFESPTGTGKSLSIICGALSWLRDHEKRQEMELVNAIQTIGNDEDDAGDDWLAAQSKQLENNRVKDRLQAQLKAIRDNDEKAAKLKEKIQIKVNNKERKDSKAYSSKSNVSMDLVNDDDADILLENFDGDSMEREEKEFAEEEEEGEEETYEGTKIYFCSRTHSQLSQFINEVKRSPFKDDVRLTPLASRATYCVNPDVKKLKNLSLLNERCLELLKAKSGKATKTNRGEETIKKRKCSGGCAYNVKANVRQLAEEINAAGVCDVEDIISAGKKSCACPYYASRAALPLSQLVVVPYNTLLHKSTRETSKIKLKGNVVIIDEAHNLLDAIGNMHSSQVTGFQLCQCYAQLNSYKDKYEKLFNAFNLLHLNQLIFVVGKLIAMIGGKPGCSAIDSSRKGIDSKIYTLGDFVHIAEIDNYNIYKLLAFCQRSKISHKLRGFAEKYRDLAANPPRNALKENGLRAFLKNISSEKSAVAKEGTALKPVIDPAVPDTSNPILPVLSFLETLTNHCQDGRIVCNQQINVGRGSLKFLLLNPAAHFRDIVSDARAVVVAGGTMRPMSEFGEQLFEAAGAPKERISEFSCDHVVAPENILPVIVRCGPSGKQLDFSYQSRSQLGMINEIGRILENVANVVPGGIVCFYPSYDYENAVYEHLKKTGAVDRLAKKKGVFREPKKSDLVEGILSSYAERVERADGGKGGAILFSVVGGKLSEGLNFGDDLGRCVIVVGLPYPNVKSPELREKMTFLDKNVKSGAGQLHYENLCIKAVNQCIGRAVRHKNDYATVLLLDHRYARDGVREALPKWMAPSLQTHEKFGPAFANVAKEMPGFVNMYNIYFG